MAIQSLGYGQELWWPYPPQNAVSSRTYETNYFLLDASGEKLEFVFSVPLTGTVDRFLAHIGAVTDAPDNGLRYSFQDVSLTDGTVDGVVDQFVTVASGNVVTGFLDPGTFDSSRSVSRNDLLAAVIDFPTFVAGDSVTISSINWAGSVTLGYPYAIFNGTKNAARIPRLWLHYTNDGGFWVPLAAWMPIPIVGTQAIVSIDTGTNPDELGNAVTFPWKMRLNKIVLPFHIIQAGGTWDLIIYDSANNVLETVSYDGDVFSSGIGNTRLMEFSLSTGLIVAPETLYRVIVKPTSLNNVGPVGGELDAMLFPYWADGRLYRTQRIDAGAWTNFNNATNGYGWVDMTFGFDGADDGRIGSGLGGPMIRPRPFAPGLAR